MVTITAKASKKLFNDPQLKTQLGRIADPVEDAENETAAAQARSNIGAGGEIGKQADDEAEASQKDLDAKKKKQKDDAFKAKKKSILQKLYSNSNSVTEAESQ